MSQIDLIIKELKFDIEIENQGDLDNLASNISSLTENFIIPDLQKAINSFFIENEDIVFDQIIINIGSIALKDKNLISKNISNKLVKKLEELRSLPSSNARSNEILVLYFLRFGFLPWWASSNATFNDFLSKNSYSDHLKPKLCGLLIKNKLNFYRFFNALNAKNRTIFFKEYLDKNFSFFLDSKLFLETLLKITFGSTDFKENTLINYELFVSFLNHKNDAKTAFHLVLKKIIEDFNIEWKSVEEVFLLKANEKKSFLNLMQFDETLFLSHQFPSKIGISSLAQIKEYIEFGTINELKNFSLPYLISEFSVLLARDAKSLIVLFYQLQVFQDPIMVFRISKLINLSNLHSYLTLYFEASHSFLLRHSFSFLKFMELKGNVKNPSFFYFINAIKKLDFFSETKKKVFYKKLMLLISEDYNIDYSLLLVEFYLFSVSQDHQSQFQEVIYFFYSDETRKQHDMTVMHLLQTPLSNDNFAASTSLSDSQRKYYTILLEQIMYLNKAVVFNSWTKSFTEVFIFNLVFEQKSASSSILLAVLKIYAETHRFDIHELVIAVLMKFYPTTFLIERHYTSIFEFSKIIN